ncbi:MAG: cell envelope integrity protein CreD, partial [Desulfobulbus sp.]|nr:cell envelope integrity protein CreD [Desulfobulbus sp.]
MDRKLFFKIFAIVGLSILLLIPLTLVEGQIRERSQRQEEVQQDIANSAAGPQTLIGPVILLRTREQVTETRRDEVGNLPVTTTRIVEHSQFIAPETLSIEGEARVETRQRGIYQARLFHLDSTQQGQFSVTTPAPDANKHLLDAEAVLILGLSDTRGVGNDPEVLINGQPRHFGKPEKGALPLAQLSVPLGRLELGKTYRFAVSFPLQLTGTSALNIAPVGEANSIRLKSNWPHPNFGGRFLPLERSVNANGFTAHWEISHLARDFGNALDPRSGEALAITFIDPVNIYLQAERAVKYGILFIVLTFAGFFLTEILRRAPIHPLQYLLVGLALAIFFLLLIAFSEHMAFAAAYGLAAAACIGLIAWYLAGALGDWRRGAAFGAGLTGLYGVLYGVLLSEDNALLMG